VLFVARYHQLCILYMCDQSEGVWSSGLLGEGIGKYKAVKYGSMVSAFPVNTITCIPPKMKR
jgi:hypothetical protein